MLLILFVLISVFHTEKIEGTYLRQIYFKLILRYKMTKEYWVVDFTDCASISGQMNKEQKFH
jgi:hypothetical protein